MLLLPQDFKYPQENKETLFSGGIGDSPTFIDDDVTKAFPNIPDITPVTDKIDDFREIDMEVLVAL